MMIADLYYISGQIIIFSSKTFFILLISPESKYSVVDGFVAHSGLLSGPDYPQYSSPYHPSNCFQNRCSIHCCCFPGFPLFLHSLFRSGSTLIENYTHFLTNPLSRTFSILQSRLSPTCCLQLTLLQRALCVGLPSLVFSN